MSGASIDTLARRALDTVAAGLTVMSVTPEEHRLLQEATSEDWNSALIRNGSGPVSGVVLDVVVTLPVE